MEGDRGLRDVEETFEVRQRGIPMLFPFDADERLAATAHAERPWHIRPEQRPSSL